MYPTTAAAAIETMTEADRWERLAEMEREFWARYGEPPAEVGLPWGPSPEEAAAAAALMDEVESQWDMEEAFGAATDDYEPDSWAEYDSWRDSLAGRYEEAELSESGSQLGHGDW